MVRSMTGYGRGIAALDGREMTIELKAVNHRYLDVSFRMPRALSYIEDPLRKRLQQALSRGHVDVFLNYKNTREDARAVQVDVPLLHAYRRALETICQETGAQDDMTLSRLARLPEVMAFTETEEDEQAVLQLCMQAAEEALASLCAMRSVEGERLASDIAARLGAIAEMVAQIEHRVPEAMAEHRAKLQQRVADILAGTPVDQERLENELAFMADRSDISEEVVRLKSHLQQVADTLAFGESVGRKLDFLVQEMNREINTIGSKASDLAIAGIVVGAKSEIEKIREQVQNIE